MPRKIHDPWQPGYRYAVWTSSIDNVGDAIAWLKSNRMDGAWKQERTEILFETLEDATAFSLAWK